VIEATPAAQDAWVAHVNQVVSATLMPKANSWYMGANVVDKPRTFLPYLDPAGIGGYRKRCDAIAASGYEGFAVAD
jgi:cyclohexanone monooxygenase